MNTKKIITVFGLLIFVLVTLLLFRSSNTAKDSVNAGDILITSKNGEKIYISQSGQVSLNSGNQKSSESWDVNKLKALQDYLQENYISSQSVDEGTLGSVTFYQNGGKVTVSINDELVSEISKDIQQGDDYGNGDNGGGEDISDFFSSPTPKPSSSPTSTPLSGGAGGDPECIYWRLSYCVVKRTPVPTQTPIPGQTTIELPPTCTDPGNRTTGRTVIGNELCLPEE